MFELLERPATSFLKGNTMSTKIFVISATVFAGFIGLASIVDRSTPTSTADRVHTTSAYERLPVVFAEQSTGNCVAAFRRGTDSDWNGVTGVSCRAVVTERQRGQVIEKVVPKGTTFSEVMEQFLYSDPWQDEYVDMESS